MNFILCKNVNKMKFGARLIQWAEKLPANHCAIYIDGYIYESVRPVARKIKFEAWLKYYTPIYVYSPPLYNHEVAKIQKELDGWIGYPYSIFQLLIIGLGLLRKSWDRVLSRIEWNGKKYLICTELLGEVLENNFGVTFGEKLDTLGIRDIWMCLNKLKEEKKWLYSDHSNQS